MKTGFAALSAVLAAWAFSATASACEKHIEHKTTAQAAITAPPAPAPTVAAPVVAEDELVLPQSKPEFTTGTTETYGLGLGCSRRKQQSVYLTH